MIGNAELRFGACQAVVLRAESEFGAPMR